ncbi:hypothetical protein [Mycolicibacterium palauense]|uniref:hypothetical protein n=1 Tax=Mycolicibacterium palauense TaxID=2034511 RepID=UPI000BFEC378|nr:hypothetical protein [Mycolicibacterium palauense]
MVGAHDGPRRPERGLPPAAGGSINGTRLLLGMLLVIIAVASIVGVGMAITSGQPAIAIAIGLIAAAFFTRVGC